MKLCALLSRFSLETAPFRIGLAIFAVATLASSLAHGLELKPEQSDLAVILSPEGENRIFATEKRAPLSQPLLPEKLIRQVEESYLNTSVGDAVSQENQISDWMLVSARIVPCSPLGLIPGPATEIYCWPEVRLIWQPVLKDFRRYTTILNWFADDRAIHALYDVPATFGLSQHDGARAELLLSKLKSAQSLPANGQAEALDNRELAEFIRLRNQVAKTLINRAVQLRSGAFDRADYSAITERPEFRDQSTARQVIDRLRTLLSDTTTFAALKEMTSFSLPEGREPPQADEWVFLKFLKNGHSMEQVDITVQSAIDGRELINLGKSPKASQMRDEPDLHTALDDMPLKDAEELRTRVLLSPSEVATKSNLINDRALTLVPNTTCGSCHKFNNLRFDFHNLSFLEDRQITVSPRVKFDVRRDLEWIAKHL